MPDPERIWLQPKCCVDPGVGRLWCCDPVWPDNPDCTAAGVEYIRADLAAPSTEGLIDLHRRLQILIKALTAIAASYEWSGRTPLVEIAKRALAHAAEKAPEPPQ